MKTKTFRVVSDLTVPDTTPDSTVAGMASNAALMLKQAAEKMYLPGTDNAKAVSINHHGVRLLQSRGEAPPTTAPSPPSSP